MTLHTQIPFSDKKKRSTTELGRIFWDSAHFCDKSDLAMLNWKHFYFCGDIWQRPTCPCDYPVCACAKGLSNRFCLSVCQSVCQSSEKFWNLNIDRVERLQKLTSLLEVFSEDIPELFYAWYRLISVECVSCLVHGLHDLHGVWLSGVCFRDGTLAHLGNTLSGCSYHSVPPSCRARLVLSTLLTLFA